MIGLPEENTDEYHPINIPLATFYTTEWFIRNISSTAMTATETTNKQRYRKQTDRQRNNQTNRQANKQTNKQINR